MQRLKTVVVDDEPLACRYMEALLKKFPEIEHVASCHNGQEALKAVSEYSPDLLFLDIQMPGLSGLDVVKRLQADTIPMVVFATAYEEYALEAFDANAVDYVVKPIDVKRLQMAVERAILRATALKQVNEQKTSLLNAIASIETEKNKDKALSEEEAPSNAYDEEPRKIVIRDREEINIINQGDIEWVDAAGDYVCVHALGETYIKRSTLSEMEKLLSMPCFKRVHRSTIVNLSFVEKVIPLAKGEYFLSLGEHQKLKVSRRYKDVIKSFLTQ
uniref:LytR/AlgR family response regulator transcription factor n=1 Tax=Ningiella ruwaisensis TaxID=2364274 RepID=UPI00109F07A8|nr:LytTR family DNA-binding domain-containing protein [Ningiella ruwaisensis]